MAEDVGVRHGTGFGGLLRELPLDQLKAGVQDVLTAAVERAAKSATSKVEDMTTRLTESADNGGTGLISAVMGGKELTASGSRVKSALSGGVAQAKDKVSEQLGRGQGTEDSGGRKSTSKVTNIIEKCDVGLPVRVVYNQWTEFEDFPSFTRKVNSVEQESDVTVNWRAQILFSHRNWESTIIEQVPDERIVWTSKGSKGTVDGTVTFHELTPDLTRIILVIEYHPQGFFEKTGNIWRAQGRRVRADFRHIQRHMMTQTILEPDKVEGWRGEIRDREVVRTHEDTLREEQEAHSESSGQEDEEGERANYAADYAGGDQEAEYQEAQR
jgi:uncharacterized membrane protein